MNQAVKHGTDRQLIMCSATVTNKAKKLARKFFNENDPDFKIMIEKSTHMNLAHLKHDFVQLSDYDKLIPLRKILKEYRKYARKHKTGAIIFCNTVQSSRAVEHALAEEGITHDSKNFTAVSLHGEIPPRMRASNF